MNERKDRHPKNREHAHHAHPTKKKKEKCCGAHPIINSEGEFVIGFERSSFSITEDLPFAFFGTLYINSQNFGVILAPYMPVGVSVTTHIDPNNGNLIFRYTDGVNIDLIILSMPEGLISYSEEIESINTSYMKTNYCLLSVNSAIDAPFLGNSDIYTLLDAPIIMTKVSALSVTGGSKTKVVIVPRSRNTPQNTQLNVVELYLRHQEIKPDSVWITTFPFIALGGEGGSLQNYLTVFIDEIFDVNEQPEVAEFKARN